jgi:hypothetical protein
LGSWSGGGGVRIARIESRVGICLFRLFFFSCDLVGCGSVLGCGEVGDLGRLNWLRSWVGEAVDSGVVWHC